MARFSRMTAVAVALTLFTSQVAPLYAGMVTTNDVIAQQRLQLAKSDLMAALERTEVHEKLVAMGVDPEAAKLRIATLTEAEVAQLNQGIAELPAGSDVLGIALTIFIVFVITDMLGATDVFTFVRPIH